MGWLELFTFCVKIVDFVVMCLIINLTLFVNIYSLVFQLTLINNNNNRDSHFNSHEPIGVDKYFKNEVKNCIMCIMFFYFMARTKQDVYLSWPLSKSVKSFVPDDKFDNLSLKPWITI